MEDERRLDRVGGSAAIASALLALTYTVGFVVLKNALVYSLALTAGSLATAIALVAVYHRLREVDPGVALLGLALGVAGTMGAFVHGGYDLATVLRPAEAGSLTGPFPADPRGLMTFGVSGVGLLLLSWVATRSATFPLRLGQLGLVLGVLLIVVYLARLIVYDAGNPFVLGSAAAAALVSVVWYLWVGRRLLART